MPRRHYDLDEVCALAESGKTAHEIVEDLGLSVTPRAVQKAVNKFVGPLPKRPPARGDRLRDVVVREMIESGLDEHYCVNGHFSAFRCYIRQLVRDGRIDTCVFVCRHCKQAGDL